MFPFAKVGGLADVSSALPKELAALGHDVRVVIPAYGGLGGEPLLELDVPFGSSTVQVRVRRLARYHGVDVLTLGATGWFERDAPYGYQDQDVLPFVFFGLAVAALAAHPSWRPDVVHAHEWHCGLVPQQLREGAARDQLAEVGVVLTIHNMAYQGPVGAAVERLIGLSPGGSLLARGIRFADRVNTVSPRYSQEVLTPAYGAGLHELLRSRADVRGILNGVDYTVFSPEVDPWLENRYDGSFVKGKRDNKAALQRASGLHPEPQRPLFSMVARLVPQKGVGLVCRAADELVARGGQLVVVGTGERRYVSALRAAAARHPGNVAVHHTSEEGVARLVYAGADLFLAPSTFEPCGLTPLISLRYGTVPVVRRTGGMADTIVDYAEDPARGLGFTFTPRRVAGLLGAVDRALTVYHQGEEWRALQRRGMAADFSWRTPANEYVALYRAARAARRPQGATTTVRRHTAPPPRRLPLPLALVHHANQYLITEGYPDREGLSSLVHGYSAVLRLHERYQVPAHLHLSGTLIEAAAWGSPEFLALVRRLRDSGLLTLVGGAYSESVLPEFDDEFNRRQLARVFELHERHLGCPPDALSVFWTPERVWRTGALAPLIADPALPNGGYRYVLLDDRLLYPTDGQYAGSDREVFDTADRSLPPPADSARLYRIADGRGLHALPVSTKLRYWVPPSDDRDWECLQRMTDMTVAPGDDTVLVYADDMEKTAGVGPWHPRHLDRYEAFLGWLTTQPHVLPVSLPAWLAERRRPAAVREVQDGTFVELARTWEAEEDYSGWSADPAWTPYQRHFTSTEEVLLDAERAGAGGALLDLAWHHLLACGYETGWRDTTRADRPPAPWARALASHARSSQVLADAAVWFATAPCAALRGELVDLDGDGEEELVLANHLLYAVLAPAYGGRLVYLAQRTDDGGVLLVGNPSDDWNWQESLNAYMDQPANHPGALADDGGVHDRYRAEVQVTTSAVICELTSLEASGPLSGARKRLHLGRGPGITVEYDVPTATGPTVVSSCLSPDYATLLREGRSVLQAYHGPGWRGMRAAKASVWLALSPGEDTDWVEPGPDREVGHGVVLRLAARQRVFSFVLGAGPTDTDACRALLADGRAALAGASLAADPPRWTA